jgi:MYXO-CTERM domain-containing protein
LQSSTSFTPLPITAPFQQVASGSVFAKAVAVAGQAVGGWVEPFMELSRFGLAKPGEGLSEQGALPIALTDLSSPMRAASAPTDNTLMLIGTAKTRRLGPSVKRGQFALLKVTEDAGGAGGAGGADDGGSAGASDGGGNGGGTATTGGATGSSGGSTTGGTGGNHPTSGGTGGSSHAGESSEAGEAGRASGGNPSGGTRTTGGSAGRDSNSGGMVASGGDGSEPPSAGDSDGCGCRLVPKRASANAAGGALLVAVAALALRKRRRTPAAMHSARA